MNFIVFIISVCRNVKLQVKLNLSADKLVEETT